MLLCYLCTYTIYIIYIRVNKDEDIEPQKKTRNIRNKKFRKNNDYKYNNVNVNDIEYDNNNDRILEINERIINNNINMSADNAATPSNISAVNAHNYNSSQHLRQQLNHISESVSHSMSQNNNINNINTVNNHPSLYNVNYVNNYRD